MEPIYLDHAATTPLRPEARATMAEYEAERYGNPSSAHRWGRAARAALEEARERLAGTLGAARREIVFTSTGTEADNLAVLGRWRTVRSARRGEGAPAVVCTSVEHKAVLKAVDAAGREGATVMLLPVDGAGRLELEALAAALSRAPDAAVVSVMWVNNEVGTVQPVAEAASLCRERGVVFHTDAVQAFGREEVRVDRTACDLLALSAHKIGGPRGIGALYVRDGIELAPLVHGGGQEHGLRPGTEAVAAAMGFAVAAELAAAERDAEADRLSALRDELERLLRERVPEMAVNGEGVGRVAHILNISLPAIPQDAILMALDLEGVGASSGSACQSGGVEPSHVLSAMGRWDAESASVRLSLGRTTSSRDIGTAAERIAAVVARLRSLATP